MLDLFSGIGGFHQGFKQAGFKFDWVGFSETDIYASSVYKYNFPGSQELGDVRLIQPRRDLPSYIDILCAGFPCQAFSQAGRRLGFDDTRGTLFFEIARLLEYYKKIKKPVQYLVLENVKGLLSHQNGRTFATIYQILTELNYTIECELLNSRNFNVPQNRERVFIVGFLGKGNRGKIFPITNDGKISDKKYSKKDKTILPSITASEFRGASKQRAQNLVSMNRLKKIGTIGKDAESSRVYSINGVSRTITDGGGMGAKTGLYEVENRIRRLTPTECCRLQGFSDDFNKYGLINNKKTLISDTQRYKQAGNAVTTSVVKKIAEKLLALTENKVKER